MEPEKQTDLSKIVQELELVTNAEENPMREEGTVVDIEGQIIKLGEETAGIEIIYGDPIELPDDLLSPKV